MILTDFDIQQRRLAYDKQQAEKNEPLTINNVNVIGHQQWYFFAIRENDQVKGICGLDTRLLGMSRPRNQQDEDEEAFYVNLAVLTHVPEFYTEIPEVRVTSISLTDPDNNTRIGVCKVEDIDVVNEIMNAKYKGNDRPKLQLIVNNPGTQDTPVEPT